MVSGNELVNHLNQLPPEKIIHSTRHNILFFETSSPGEARALLQKLRAHFGENAEQKKGIVQVSHFNYFIYKPTETPSNDVVLMPRPSLANKGEPNALGKRLLKNFASFLRDNGFDDLLETDPDHPFDPYSKH